MRWSTLKELLKVLAICLLVKAQKNGHHHNNNNINGDDIDVVTLGVAEASRAYGTELMILENAYMTDKTHRFEDFFWTGSGDGSLGDEDYLWGTDSPTTIYETKTVVSTVYVDSPTTQINASNVETTTKCSLDCGETTAIPSEEINPTPVTTADDTTTEDDFLDANREFWLLTVLKSDGKDPVIIDLKNSLAKLYKTAFQRQQEQHLGIISRGKRATSESPGKILDKPVKVYIHNVEKTNNQEEIQVLYHVSVAGKPVAAETAAQDMVLVSDEEVQNELGFPFIIKAEPYLKASKPQSLARPNNTLLFIGISIVGLLIILLLIAFVSLAIAKRKRAIKAAGLDNRRQIFERSVEVQETKKTSGEQTPTYINFRDQNKPMNRPQSSYSSSSSSHASLDISPLMRQRETHVPPRKPPRPKAAINKTAPLVARRIAPEFFDSDSSIASKNDSPDTIYAGNYESGVISPKSYLSMPSIKSFPRGSMPEPLSKVLEPVSVLHLDVGEDENLFDNNDRSKRLLIRHGSVGTVEDPGVIGPVVWNMHRERMQHGVSVDEGIDDLKLASNVSRMRKRFHELLDDTFSLFGSRRPSPVHETKSSDLKSHSALNQRVGDIGKPPIRPRPKTTDLRKVVQGPSSGPKKGAWTSTAPSPLVRPLSADPALTNPKINVNFILAEGQFKSSDPALPLIEAIKSEIEKCSLPGSTTDLRQ